MKSCNPSRFDTKKYDDMLRANGLEVVTYMYSSDSHRLSRFHFFIDANSRLYVCFTSCDHELTMKILSFAPSGLIRSGIVFKKTVKFIPNPNFSRKWVIYAREIEQMREVLHAMRRDYFNVGRRRGVAKSDGLETHGEKLISVTEMSEFVKASNLQNDADAGHKARALHRVVRAMHDGECPKCGHLGTSESFYYPKEVTNSGPAWSCPRGIHEESCRCERLVREACHMCPKCEFTITDTEAEAALKEFHPFMKPNYEIFLEWREEFQKKSKETAEASE